MDVHPIPQDEPEPQSLTGEWVKPGSPHAAFRCTDSECEHIFAGRVPAIFLELPLCPLCRAASWLYGILRD